MNNNDNLNYDNSHNLTDSQIMSEEEAKKIADIQQEFLKSYSDSKDKISIEQWLPQEIQKQLPEKSPDEIKVMSNEIFDTIRINDVMRESQKKAIANGQSKESWLASSLQQATSNMTTQESITYLSEIDEAVKNANNQMYEAITTKKSGNTIVSQNPNLDGYIAEQHYVNSFNINAKAKNNKATAEVVQPKNGTYSKNGFDIVIKDASGKIVHQYQVKFGATAEDTIKMIKEGNYNNQILVVPEDQVEAVKKAFPNKTVTSKISYDGVSSTTLTKAQAKILQKKAQQYEFEHSDWSKISNKDLAKGIAGQVSNASLQGALYGAGINMASKIFQGEKIEGDEVVEAAITSGADAGIKAATAGALKVASEKEILTVIPKGTPASTFANIAFVAIEDVKVLGKVATGDLTIEEGIDEVEQTTGSCVAGIAASAKGAAIGAKIGAVLGPVGSAVGGFVGGTVGYIAGSKFGQTVVKCAQKIRDKARELVSELGDVISTGFNNIKEKLFSFF